jgi:ribosomal protein S18 acetylase RimI-like enzyme
MLLLFRYLEILAIHPSHQNKRIGPQLLDHHLSLISGPEARLTPGAAYLESSPPAKKLYASRGFEDIGDVKAEGWTGGFPAMIRPRQ